MVNTNQKDNMNNEDLRECVKCTQKDHKDNMFLGINDIVENDVEDVTIDNFEKEYLKGYSIEDYFCGPCANESLKILEKH